MSRAYYRPSVGDRVWFRDENGQRVQGTVSHADAGSNDGTGRIGVMVETAPGTVYWRAYAEVRS